MHLKLWLHRKDVGDCEFGLLIAGPMERRASLMVNLINVQILMLGEIVKANGLVPLCGDMQAICAVHIRDVNVGAHFIYHQLD